MKSDIARPDPLKLKTCWTQSPEDCSLYSSSWSAGRWNPVLHQRSVRCCSWHDQSGHEPALCRSSRALYTDIKIILSHAGGIVSYWARRIALGQYEEANQITYDRGMYDFTLRNRDMEDGIKILKRLYYDTMSPAGNGAFRTLQELVDPSHILLATDYVFLPKRLVSSKIAAVRRYDGFDSQTVAAIERENALELFPRFKEV